MDSRLSNFGQQIMSSSPAMSSRNPVYPFFKPSTQTYIPSNLQMNYPKPPTYTNLPPPYYDPQYMYKTRNSMYNTTLQDELKDIKKLMKAKEVDSRKRSLLGRVGSVMNLLDRHDSKSNLPTTPQPIILPVQNYSQYENQFSEIIKSMQKQQETITEMVKSMRDLHHTPYNFPASGREYHHRLPSRSTSPPTVNILSPKQPITDLNFIEEDEDEHQNYLDEQRKYQFNANLPDAEKAKLYQKLRAERLAREQEMARSKLRGKSLFRAYVFGVLFPILTFSSLLKRKGLIKNDALKNMQDSITLYLEVSQS